MPRDPIPRRTREDAAIACMAVAAVRMAQTAIRKGIADYGSTNACLRLDEIVSTEAAILAQQARGDYALRGAHWSVFVADFRQDAKAIEAARACHEARIDGLRWAEAASMLMDRWTP